MSFIKRMTDKFSKGKLDESTVAADIAPVQSTIDTKKPKRARIDQIMLSEGTTSEQIVDAFKDNGFKVKTMHPSPFGLQIDFYVTLSKEDVEKSIKELPVEDFNIKGKSIFIKIKG